MTTIPAQHLDLIRMIAGRVYRSLSLRGRMLFALDDLVGEGYIGYQQAVSRFDPALGRSFKGFAEWRIKGAMLDALRRMDPLSRDERGRFNLLEKTGQSLTGQLGRPPTEEEIAAAMHVTIQEYLALQQSCFPIEECSLEEVLESHSPQLPTAPDQSLTVEEELDRAGIVKRLHQLYDAGVIKERDIIIMGLALEQGRTQPQIARILGISSSRVWQRVSATVAALLSCP